MFILMNKTAYTIGCYGFALIFLYPIVAHVLMYELGYFADKLPDGKYWIVIQVLLSGPMLLAIGWMLYFRLGEKIIHKVFGVLFSLIGAWWLFMIFRDIAREAA